MIGDRRITTDDLVLFLFFFTEITANQFFLLYHYFILQVNMMHNVKLLSCVNVYCRNLRTKYLTFCCLAGRFSWQKSDI